jgi:short-subunit dehydrogenase
MSKSIAVFGAGPGLGQAVAHRYAKEGYDVVLVARRPEPLERLAGDLAQAGATAHVVTADLSEVAALPALADRIRAEVGDVDAFYYGAAANGFIPVLELTPRRANDLMPLGVYTPLALVHEFLPGMVVHGDGAILTAQGASALHGIPHISGGFALAAQRNYLQCLHAEVADKGVYVGMLYIGAAIKGTPFHTAREAARAEGDPVPEMPTADPAHLADLLWNMHNTKSPAETTYPERRVDR